MSEEDLPRELAAAVHADFLENRLEVLLNRVRRDRQRAGDLVGRATPEHQSSHRLLSFRQPVGSDNERGEVGGAGWLDDQSDYRRGRVCT